MRKIFLSLLCLTACLDKPPVNPDPYNNLQFDVSYTNGLSHQERLSYYYFDEGIQYLPKNVLFSLNRPKENSIGLYDELLLATPERYGLYPNLLDRKLPPLGITISPDKEYVPMAGINCATCHTTLISHKNKAIFVDGSASLFALDRFIKEMVVSMANTLANPIEFNRFFDRYMALAAISEKEPHEFDSFAGSKKYKDFQLQLNDHYQGRRNLDKKKLRQFSDSLNALSGAFPTETQLDSRVKMFGYLVKRFVFFYEQGAYANTHPGSTVSPAGLGRANPWAIVKNLLAANIEHKEAKDWPVEAGGPVNPPNIWEFNRAKWIFWTGTTNSVLERNLAQGVSLVTDFNWDTYETTIRLRKINQIAKLSEKIKAPIWPENILGKINMQQADAGKPIFQKECLSCHQHNYQQGTAVYSYPYMNVGTDPAYAKGQMESFYGKDLFKDVITPWIKKIKILAYQREGIKNPENYEQDRKPEWRAPKANELAARPLYGIWASAPYLHNGSVLSIRELLKKPEDRLKSFFVGTSEYNPHDLGFENHELYFSSKLEVDCANCTGNSNQGHVFGVSLTEEQKDQLIEFLKVYTSETRF